MLFAWAVVLGVFGFAGTALWTALTRRAAVAKKLVAGALLAGVIGAIGSGQDLGLQKVASTLLLPTGLLWIALAVFAMWALSLGQKRLGQALAATWLIYTIMSNSWISLALLNDLESRIPRGQIPAGATLDAIIVPGGGARFDARGEAQLGDTGDRVMLAARLYKAGRARYLVTTGSSIPSISVAQDLSEATRIIWRDLGVPDEAIIRLPEPQNTSQEIIAAKKLVDARGWKEVGVVGSAYHLPRIMALCEREHLSAIPLAADRRSGPFVWHPISLIPSINSARAISTVAWETLGRWIGR